MCIDHKTKEIKFRDPYPIWAKALVAAYLAEEDFLRGSRLFDAAAIKNALSCATVGKWLPSSVIDNSLSPKPTL